MCVEFNPESTSTKTWNPEQSSGVSMPCPTCVFLAKVGGVTKKLGQLEALDLTETIFNYRM